MTTPEHVQVPMGRLNDVERAALPGCSSHGSAGSESFTRVGGVSEPSGF
jgi:hypothetical protein